MFFFSGPVSGSGLPRSPGSSGSGSATLLREAAKKVLYFSGPNPLRGGGVRARPLRKKEVKALVVGPLKKNFFLRLP